MQNGSANANESQESTCSDITVDVAGLVVAAEVLGSQATEEDLMQFLQDALNYQTPADQDLTAPSAAVEEVLEPASEDLLALQEDKRKKLARMAAESMKVCPDRKSHV